MSNQLFALSGQFETPDEIMHAAEEVNKKYKQYDVNTPYPVHGMDGAMGMGESPIGWVTITVGTTFMPTTATKAMITPQNSRPIKVTPPTEVVRADVTPLSDAEVGRLIGFLRKGVPPSQAAASKQGKSRT